jgi:hypothetical protein
MNKILIGRFVLRYNVNGVELSWLSRDRSSSKLLFTFYGRVGVEKGKSSRWAEHYISIRRVRNGK